ncbi:uncharacterized protein THITE_2075708 [Thermothielavioides terrestris NRRL 8126]|uniref:Uncharacterized protein n=1 Tax=Thermothielavioides terrestris (strain ATCC 38088 / NRRL 8126) TaxID=578455 RepID=G2R4Y7_THETT|nr:uncharacterized protein THITE_2075708 [Thermothielavioides terrestris NRRL 8126]AEO66972.1 hypothetical protein THITE_2075708 [Thermothielavioides terrestris NRRL 8126]
MSRLSQSFVASLARGLNSAQVPCVLWGHCLLVLHGVPSIIGVTDLPAYFALASDESVFPPWRPGRGLGVYPSAAGPVVALRSHILLEAYMRIYARDHGKQVGSIGISMIAYMQLYVDEDGFLDADLLPEPLRTFYGELKQWKKPLRQWTLEFRAALGVPEEESESDDGY